MVAWVVELWGQVEAWLLALVDSVWALPTLFATTAGDGFFPPIPGETVIVMLAVGAQSGGGVAWGLVLLVAALGAWCGDQLAYALGRAVGTRALPVLRGSAVSAPSPGRPAPSTGAARPSSWARGSCPSGGRRST